MTRQGMVMVIVGDPVARRRITQVLAAHHVILREHPVLPRTLAAGALLLVHDLAPWDDDALGALVRLRRQHPSLQMLLYHPPTREACAVTAIASQLPHVSAWPWRDDDEGPGPLREHVRSLLYTHPTAWTLHRLCQSLPDLPPPVQAFLVAAVNHLGRGGRKALRTAVIAQRTGWALRTVERNARTAGVPRPGLLLQWVTLLHVAIERDAGRGSMSRTTAWVGLHSEQLRRMRKRLVPEVSAATFTVEAVATAFRHACQRAPGTAHTGADRANGRH